MSERRREKTRPQDNEHCFRGLDRQYWLLKAKGFKPRITNGRDGFRVDYATERDVLDPARVPNADDFAYQNGGMERPQETVMRPGTYLRFYDSRPKRVHDSRSKRWVSNWWLDYDNFTRIRAWASERNQSLAVAAQSCLVIPPEWGDCGRLVKAGLNRRLRAYVGKGKPATGTVSPFNAGRDKTKQPLIATPAQLEIKQWFVPGEPALLSALFVQQGALDAFRENEFKGREEGCRDSCGE